MGLVKYRLGDLIAQCDERNENLSYTADDVKGISTEKIFIETKANLDGVNLQFYKVVRPGCFAYVADTSRRGDKIAIAFNRSDKGFLISSIYTVFRVVKPEVLVSDYLFLFFNRPEFDRYARFCSFGSARETFDWDEMCDVEIELPPVSVQEKAVGVYRGLLANRAAYEAGLSDLKLLCDATIEDLRRKLPCEKIGKYIERQDVRNGTNGTKNVMGVSTSKIFREPTSKVNKNDLANYKVVKPRQISFVQTTHNEKVFAYAFNDTDQDIVVTSVNEVFSTDEDKLLPEYLCMFFNRKEFDRYARFHSWGSARETFNWEDMCEVSIPIPEMAVQRVVVDLYRVYRKRRETVERLSSMIAGICPILLSGAAGVSEAGSGFGF